MNHMIFIWLAGAAGWVLLELGHPSLFLFLSGALGSVGAAVGAWYGFSLPVQAIIFLGGMVAAFVPLHLWVRAKQQHNAHLQTNMYALIGKRAIVITEIRPHEIGYVRVGGQQWAARSVGNLFFTQGTTVEVTQIIGIHLLVRSMT